MKQHRRVLFFASFISCIFLFAVPACPGGTQSEKGASAGFKFTIDFTKQYVDSWIEHLGHLKDQPGVRMLEVGTFEGRSAIWFLEHVVNHPSSEIVCIDLFSAEGLEDRFDHNIKVSGHSKRVQKLKGYSQRVMRNMRLDSFDVIYIDGCHTAWCVYQDLALSWPLLKKGGVLILDDYVFHTEHPENHPKTAIDPFLVALGHSFTLLEKGRQVIVRKRR